MPMPYPSSLVACLCADWCGVCRDYRGQFERLAAQFPSACFLYLDVEEEAALLYPFDDVDSFPTVLIAVDKQALFFGPITPEPATLDRLLRGYLPPAAAPSLLIKPELTALVERLYASRVRRQRRSQNV